MTGAFQNEHVLAAFMLDYCDLLQSIKKTELHLGQQFELKVTSQGCYTLKAAFFL